MFHTNFLGTLSKSLGQILCVAGSLHVLFHFLSDASQDPLPDTISKEAIAAATNFVEVCCQQTAFIAGRSEIYKEIELIQADYM